MIHDTIMTLHRRHLHSIPEHQAIAATKKRFGTEFRIKFTTEIGFNNKINFLDVNINSSHEYVVTQPFVKPTNSGINPN